MPPPSTPLDLRHTGLRVTGPRLRILNILRQSSQRHMCVDEIHRHILQDGADVGLATIYRVLSQFEQAGLILRNHFEGGKAVYEINEGHHHDHLVCVACGRVEEFHDDDIERLQEQIAQMRGYTLQAHSLALYGLCGKPDCPGSAEQTQTHAPAPRMA